MSERRTSRPELLAPAGDWDAMVAAVQNGADAVYLGGTAFSARQYAANFDRDTLRKAIDYAHLRDVRIYVTVNTLIKDAELDAALNHLADLYASGVDGVIIQDLGLVALACKALPGLQLHASTQMTTHSAEGVRLLRGIGFHRVVVAREMSLRELDELCRQGLEIEVFVHGAICICYSGQCLMSSLIGGRSGNRGRCAQPCRLEYALVNRAGEELAEVTKVGPHLLSPKDLQTIDLLPELVQAGVSALKIEGRMKRPEYVATVVRVYRTALDRVLADPEGFTVSAREHEELEQAFTRGFTSGYLTGNQGREMMSYQRPSNRGTFLGRVTGYDHRDKEALVKLEAPLNPGDGVEFWVTKGGRVGTSAGTQAGTPGETVRFSVEGHLRPGDRVFKTADAELLAKAEATFKSPREKKAIPLSLRVSLHAGAPAVVELADRAGHNGRAVGTFLAEPARSHPLDQEALRSRLDRFGNTPFVIDEWVFDLEPGLMVPWSELNDLRHAALADLEGLRTAAFGPSATDVDQARSAVSMTLREMELTTTPARNTPAGMVRGVKPQLTVAVGDIEALGAAVAAGADRVIFGGESFRGPGRSEGFRDVDTVREAVRRCRASGVEAVLAFDRILRGVQVDTAYRLAQDVLDAPDGERPHGLLVGNLGLLGLLGARVTGLVELAADSPLNVLNQATMAFLVNLGVTMVTASPELTLTEAGALARADGPRVEALVQGPITMMVSEYCAPGAVLGGRAASEACSQPCGSQRFGLRDRLNLVFPVVTDSACRMHVQNPKELCMVDYLPQLAGAGFSSLRIEARTRDANYVGVVVRAYRRALDDSEADKAGLRAEVAAQSPQGVTKGHFFRGVE